MNGQAHLIGNLATAAATLAYIASTPAQEPLMPILAGLGLGIIANPDVRDQEAVRNTGEHVVDAIFGKLIGKLWTAYWWPLAKLVPHRSRWSHWVPIGTIVALLYLLVPTLTLYWAYTANPAPLSDYLSSVLRSDAVWWLLVAWVIQDAVHLVQDWL